MTNQVDAGYDHAQDLHTRSDEERGKLTLDQLDDYAEAEHDVDFAVGMESYISEERQKQSDEIE